jgi:prophage antirepressor-like protein
MQNPQNLPACFQFEGRAVRHTVDAMGNPWFVLSDVCAVLNLADVSSTARSLDEDEKGQGSTPTPGGNQSVTMVTEGGLYTVILRCRYATNHGSVAHRFRKWVTAEVLPSIRKTGGYGRREPEKTLSRAELARNWADAEERAEASEAARLSFAKQVADLGNQELQRNIFLTGPVFFG